MSNVSGCNSGSVHCHVSRGLMVTFVMPLVGDVTVGTLGGKFCGRVVKENVALLASRPPTSCATTRHQYVVSQPSVAVVYCTCENPPVTKGRFGLVPR